MDNLEVGFSILNSDIAVGAPPTPKTLRIAKALGYAAVLHDCSDDADSGAQENGVRQRVEAARLEYHTADLAPNGVAREAVLATVESLIARLPKPVFVVSHDPDRAAALMAAATTPNGSDRGPGTGSDRPGKSARHSRRAA